MLNIIIVRLIKMKLTNRHFPHSQPHTFTQRYTTFQMYLAKLLPLLVLTVGFFLYKISYDNNKNVVCQRDNTHEWLYAINRFMENDKYSITLLIGQWLIEIPIVSMTIYWVAKMKNMRFPVAAAVFYFTRAFSLQIFSLPFPKQMVWREPIVPSFLVPYDRTRDFYFSGHTGVACLITMEVIRLGFPQWMRYACVGMVAYLILMLLASRVHYFIDIVGGVVFVLFIYDMSEELIYYLDYFWSFPHLLYSKVRQSCCGETDQGYNSLVDEIGSK